jgi:hypothetical protein
MSDATTLSKGLRSEHVPRLLRPFHVDDPLARPRPDHHDLTLLALGLLSRWMALEATFDALGRLVVSHGAEGTPSRLLSSDGRRLPWLAVSRWPYPWTISVPFIPSLTWNRQMNGYVPGARSIATC